jgi:SAM-dependent methyltransferase
VTPEKSATGPSAGPSRRHGPRRDRHELYEAAVQCPEADVHFLNRVYKEWNKRPPRSLREDFCGTAAFSAAWVKSRKDTVAYGVDLHGPTLAWGKRRHVVPLGEEAARVHLIQEDVLSARTPKVDVVAAFNFSYFIFHTRDELRNYFRRARSALAPRGLLILDIFGGWESQALTVTRKRRPGFTYVWEQASFDPISHRTVFHIHFSFRDGTRIKRAFTYRWRLWSVPEVLEILQEAGYRRSCVYLEGTDHGAGHGNGVFRRTARAQSCPGWLGYIVAR